MIPLPASFEEAMETRDRLFALVTQAAMETMPARQLALIAAAKEALDLLPLIRVFIALEARRRAYDLPPAIIIKDPDYTKEGKR